VLRRAADVAEQAGALEDAGRALITLIEEHAARINERDLLEAYQRADGLLKETQDAETVARMRACAARIASARLGALRRPPPRSRTYFWTNFNLMERVRAYEARYIRRALVEAQGSVTNAARLPGIDHHAKLAWMLAGRHKELAHLRTPPEPRRRSIITGSQHRRRPPAPSAVKILYAEDSATGATALKDTLEELGWTAELCTDSAEAVRKIESREHFDILILDSELSGGLGLELARLARELPHRRRTPIIMLSASDVERDAWRAGVNAFLMKPQDMGKLAATVARLLPKGNTSRK
jgi:CheY-like chemotaxis protein